MIFQGRTDQLPRPPGAKNKPDYQYNICFKNSVLKKKKKNPCASNETGPTPSGMKGTCVTAPHLEAVVHAAGDYLGPLHVEVRAQHLVPVTSRMVLLR